MKKPPKKRTSGRSPARRGKGERETPNDELLPEYDATLIRDGVRGKYAAHYAEGTNVVVLDPDVAAEFPNAAAVNAVLRELIKIRRGRPEPESKRRPRRSA
jgi:hypothetical protein